MSASVRDLHPDHQCVRCSECHFSKAKSRLAIIKSKKTIQEQHVRFEEETSMGTFDVCALKDIEENEDYANTDAMSIITLVQASGLTQRS